MNWIANWRSLRTAGIPSAELNVSQSRVAAATHDTWIYAAAFVFGLAMGVHHVTVALTLPAIAVVVYRTEGLKFFTSRRILYAALISIGALILVYSYLPWAASRSPGSTCQDAARRGHGSAVC